MRQVARSQHQTGCALAAALLESWCGGSSTCDRSASSRAKARVRLDSPGQVERAALFPTTPARAASPRPSPGLGFTEPGSRLARRVSRGVRRTPANKRMKLTRPGSGERRAGALQLIRGVRRLAQRDPTCIDVPSPC
jgi:hypothetical protein